MFSETSFSLIQKARHKYVGAKEQCERRGTLIIWRTHRNQELGWLWCMPAPTWAACGWACCCGLWPDFLSALSQSEEAGISLRAMETSLPQVCISWKAKVLYKAKTIRAAPSQWLLGCLLLEPEEWILQTIGRVSFRKWFTEFRG